MKQLYTLFFLSSDVNTQQIRLYLKGPNMPSIENQIIELTNDNATFFYYVQELCNLIEWNKKFETNRHIWEPTYTIVYSAPNDDNNLLKSMLEKTNSKRSIKNEFDGLVKEVYFTIVICYYLFKI